MKVFKQVGSKERFLEVYQNVNKVRLNEAFGQTLNPQAVLAEAFDELKAGTLEIKHSSTQAEDNESFVELLCVDKEGNNITFTFKAITEEGEQEGVFNVREVTLETFSFDSTADEESVELSGDALKQFNVQHQNELTEIIDKYMDVEEEEPIDTLYEDAVKLIDKVPYKAGSERMVKQSQYADEKPTNPDVRVDAEELKKFVNEDIKDTDITKMADRAIEHYYNTSHGQTKQEILNFAAGEAQRALVDMVSQAGKQGIFVPDEVINVLREKLINTIAKEIFTKNLKSMNENEYPEGLGKEFKPESQSEYAKKTKAEKKRKTKKVKIKEYYNVVDTEFNREHFGEFVGKTFDKPIPYAQVKVLKEQYEVDDDDIEGIPDVEDIPVNPKAEKTAMKDIKRELPKGDTIDPYSEITLSEDDDDDDSPESKDDGMSFEPKGDELEQLAQEKEKVGDMLQGGKADTKSPLEYDPDQVMKGLDVEKEHSDNPMVAIEIATDHLEEFPDYYTRLDQMEKEARAELGWDKKGNGEEKPSDEEDKEMTDELLGYKPMNVGDKMDEEFDFAASEREYADKDAYKKYLEYSEKDFNNLGDSEKEEYFELWKQFRGAEKMDESLYEGGKQLSDFVDAPGSTEIWYMKPDEFRYLIHGYDMIQKYNPEKMPDPNNLEKTHSLLGTIAETDPETIFHKLNNWGGLEVNELLKEKGLGHTSMSVGDIVKIGNKVLMVDGYGFKELSSTPDNVSTTGGVRFDVDNATLAESQIRMAKQVLNNRGLKDGMTKKEAVQILIKHNIK